MTKTIEARMQSIEQQLSELRKELEESLARYNTSYKQSQYPFTNGDVSKFRSGAIGNIPETKCLWDSIPVEDRYKSMGLNCPCAKCSAWC